MAYSRAQMAATILRRLRKADRTQTWLARKLGISNGLLSQALNEKSLTNVCNRAIAKLDKELGQ